LINIPQEILTILEKTRTQQELDLSGKGLEAIDVTKHTSLKVLNLSYNKLKSVALHNNALLTTL
jgi:hypothetical protein